MRYELTKDLETGNAIIDGEHRELFRAVNTLMDACGKGQGLSLIHISFRTLTMPVSMSTSTSAAWA